MGRVEPDPVDELELGNGLDIPKEPFVGTLLLPAEVDGVLVPELAVFCAQTRVFSELITKAAEQKRSRRTVQKLRMEPLKLVRVSHIRQPSAPGASRRCPGQNTR